MDDSALQMAWFIINDTYRSDLCLVYSPHIIALAAVYMAFAIHPPSDTKEKKPSDTKEKKDSPPAASTTTTTESPKRISIPLPPRSSSLDSPNKALHPSLPSRPDFLASASPLITPAAQVIAKPIQKLDHITFLSRLNVPLALILEAIQDITSLYTLWHAYEEVPIGELGKNFTSSNAEERVIKILSRMRDARTLAAAHP